MRGVSLLSNKANPMYKCIIALTTTNGKMYWYGDKISEEEYKPLPLMDRIKFTKVEDVPMDTFTQSITNNLNR